MCTRQPPSGQEIHHLLDISRMEYVQRLTHPSSRPDPASSSKRCHDIHEPVVSRPHHRAHYDFTHVHTLTHRRSRSAHPVRSGIRCTAITAALRQTGTRMARSEGATLQLTGRHGRAWLLGHMAERPVQRASRSA